MDRYGRRVPLILGSFAVVAGGIGQTFTNGPDGFLGTRMIIGFGIALTGTSAPTLLMELSHPRFRGPASLLYNCSWYIGATIIGWITFGSLRMTGSWSWRLPALLQVFPEVILFIVYVDKYGIAHRYSVVFFMPESPRFLVSVGKNDQALAILAKYHVGSAARQREQT